MKDPRFCDLNIITCLDDTSRYGTGVELFKKAMSENTIVIFVQATKIEDNSGHSTAPLI